MEDLLAATTAFVLTHLIPAAPAVRAVLVRSLGRPLYIAVYSAISLGVIVWLAVAYANAPYREVWSPVAWTRWVPVLVMPLSCVLLAAGLTTPNPLSLSPVRRAFDPARPGIVSVTRHPVLWGLALWALAHVVANGDAASLILFGLLSALAVAGMTSADAKARGRLGDAAWRGTVAAARAGGVDWRGIGWARPVTGLLLYGGLFFAHPFVIGVSPVP